MSKEQTALTKFFDKIRINYDKDSEEYEQILTDYVLAKEFEKKQICDMYIQGRNDVNLDYYPEKHAIETYNEKFGK